MSTHVGTRAREVPIPLIRVNQAFIVAGVVVGAIFSAPVVIGLVWLVLLAALAGGPRYHVVMRLARPFLKRRIATAPTEPFEMTRFNLSLAVGILTVAVAGLALGWTTFGWVVAGLVAVVAAIAICGYCLGCAMYLRLRVWGLLPKSEVR